MTINEFLTFMQILMGLVFLTMWVTMSTSAVVVFRTFYLKAIALCGLQLFIYWLLLALIAEFVKRI